MRQWCLRLPGRDAVRLWISMLSLDTRMLPRRKPLRSIGKELLPGGRYGRKWKLPAKVDMLLRLLLRHQLSSLLRELFRTAGVLSMTIAEKARLN